ncbi:MAG: hypothetical protein LBK75_00700 [Oscillospiraceae bacterium]|jgi:hypothetical protein|nr:hypothetical protein [Oscillospiraceae bacterium]
MKRASVLAMVCLLALSLTISVYAIADVSDQISGYAMSVTPTSGSRLAIQFSVTASYQMAVIGGKTIAVYEKSGSSWTYVGGFAQSSTGMTRTNAFNYGNTIYYNGQSGKEYKVSVEVFAEDSTGASDARTQVFYVTAS